MLGVSVADLEAQDKNSCESSGATSPTTPAHAGSKRCSLLAKRSDSAGSPAGGAPRLGAAGLGAPR